MGGGNGSEHRCRRNARLPGDPFVEVTHDRGGGSGGVPLPCAVATASSPGGETPPLPEVLFRLVFCGLFIVMLGRFHRLHGLRSGTTFDRKIASRRGTGHGKPTLFWIRS
jgi:hypothetical protein